MRRLPPFAELVAFEAVAFPTVLEIVFPGYAVGHLALFVWALVLLVRYRQPATVPLLIVTFGLVYDNFIIAAGSTIGHGPLLERLSVHAFSCMRLGRPC